MNILDILYLIDRSHTPGKSALVSVGEEIFNSGAFSINPTGTLTLPQPLTGFFRQWTHLSAQLTAGVFGAAGDFLRLNRLPLALDVQTTLVHLVPNNNIASSSIPLIGTLTIGVAGEGNTQVFGIEPFFVSKNEVLQLFVTATTAASTMNVSGWYKDYPV